MIYESIQKALTGLSSNWADLQVAVDNLITAAGPGPIAATTLGAATGQFQQWSAAAGRQVTALDACSAAAGTYPNISTLLSNASTCLASSFNDIGLIEASIGPGSALDMLRSRPSAAWANAVAAEVADLLALNQKLVQDLNEITAPESQAISQARISSTVNDISTYPVFTQEFAPGSGGGDISARSWQGSSSGGLGSFVKRSIGDVLGRTPRSADPKSFVAALNASFTSKEFEGRTVIEYQPRGYLGTTELGGTVTGAQASIYLRAKNTSDVAMPLLDKLEPLRPDPDPQEVDAVRAIVRDEFQELVDELSNEGGPRVQRVDDLFNLLLAGDFVTLDNGDPISASTNNMLRDEIGAGELGRLGDVFGMTRNRVNTIIEEQNLTNFRILRDYLDSLNESWVRFRVGFVNGTQNFLGTQLVRLSRTLAVINESVDEVSYAMNSVFLGAAERKTTRIEVPGVPTMSVDDLLSWVSEFATAEGPRLIQDGGKQGVRRVVPTLERLRNLVRDSDGRIRHPGAQHPRVRKSMEELRDQLNDAAQLAGAV